MRTHRLLGSGVVGASLLAAVPGVLALAPVADAHREPPLPFKDARLEIEYNATDGDAGLQVFVDAEEWKEFEIRRPDGRRIVSITARGVLKDFGLTEIFSESSEPPFTELPFEEFKQLFPEGTYRFEGETIDGRDMTSDVQFSHVVLDAPVFTQPANGGTLPASDAVVQWAAVPGAVDYQVIVTRQNPLRVLDVTMNAEDTSLTVPAEFLDVGVEYKVEVHASDASGNRIFTEIGFTTT